MRKTGTTTKRKPKRDLAQIKRDLTQLIEDHVREDCRRTGRPNPFDLAYAYALALALALRSKSGGHNHAL